MIVPSPILLIAAAQALAHHGFVHPRLPLRPDGTEDATGAPFVQQAGFWSHYEHRVDCSAWPFHPAWGLRQIVHFVREQELLLDEGAIGDLLLCCDDAGRPARLGIVVSGIEHRRWPIREARWRCDLLCGTLEEAGVVAGAWYPRSRGDRFIPWHRSRHWHDRAPGTTGRAA